MLVTLCWATFCLARYCYWPIDTDVYRRGRPVRSRVHQRGTSRSWRRHRDETSSRVHSGTWRCCCTSSTSLLTAQRCRRRLLDRSRPLYRKQEQPETAYIRQRESGSVVRIRMRTHESRLPPKFNGHFRVHGHIADKIFMIIRSLHPEIKAKMWKLLCLAKLNNSFKNCCIPIRKRMTSKM